MGRGRLATVATPTPAAMVTSRLTSDGQTNVPQPAPTALAFRKHNEFAYEIEGAQVILTKDDPFARHDPIMLLEEWDSTADRQAYARP